jgi:hypothetical protein
MVVGQTHIVGTSSGLGARPGSCGNRRCRPSDAAVLGSWQLASEAGSMQPQNCSERKPEGPETRSATAAGLGRAKDRASRRKGSGGPLAPVLEPIQPVVNVARDQPRVVTSIAPGEVNADAEVRIRAVCVLVVSLGGVRRSRRDRPLDAVFEPQRASRLVILWSP